MKTQLEQRQQAVLQLHLSDQQVDYTPRTTKLFVGVYWFHPVRPPVPHAVSAL